MGGMGTGEKKKKGKTTREEKESVVYTMLVGESHNIRQINLQTC